MSAHTPGPWKARCIDDDRGRPDWLVFFPDGEDASVLTEANARLIAAAPEMFTALLAIVNDWSSSEDHDVPLAAIVAARAAIAQARSVSAQASEPAAGEAPG